LIDAGELGVCPIPVRGRRLELRASGGGVTPSSDEFLKKVCANLVEPRDFGSESLAYGHHLSTGFQKLLEQVSPNAVETSDFLLGRCSGKREAPET
jgi:hypothetical protein